MTPYLQNEKFAYLKIVKSKKGQSLPICFMVPTHLLEVVAFWI